MIEVFRTNINKPSVAKNIRKQLIENFPESSFNFDIQDCDKILRVKSTNNINEKVIDFIKSSGYLCEVLED
jgi:NurA-like 5'-3' nuclease